MSDPHRFDDLFADFGPIRLRRFFGGEGIYAGDVMIGMVFNADTIYFKTDPDTRKAFDAEGSKPFTFQKGGETVVTTWLSLPDRLYDETEELARWARAALAVAQAAPTAKKKARKAASAPRARTKRR
ncbi:MAG TPA: TfoX/Sxy family protein [Rhizomicrobium sp.]|jgi:DNA transformation protein|nr:TfoX/Sxy family protein [Rhizomicrobium sp.]